MTQQSIGKNTITQAIKKAAGTITAAAVMFMAGFVALPPAARAETMGAFLADTSEFKYLGEFTAPEAAAGLVYNGTAQELVTAGSTTAGTLVYALEKTALTARLSPRGLTRAFTPYGTR